MTTRNILCITGFAFLLGGCALTPDYERPDLDLPDEWIRTSETQASIANLPWWEMYEDVTLSNLIEMALEANEDLAVALARM